MGRFGKDKTQTWLTDPRLLAWIGPIDTDPATRADNPTAATHFYTEADDGLSKPWHGFVYCNPPFNDILPWVSRCLLHDGPFVMLLPARTGSRWFQDVAEIPRIRMFFFRKRLQYMADHGVKQSSSPFDSMLLCDSGGYRRMRLRDEGNFPGVWL